MAVTRPRGTMLRNRSVFDLEIAPNADVALTKLNRGTDIVLRDASGATHGMINQNNKGIYNMADGVNLQDAVTMRQLNNAMANAGTAAEWQESVLSYVLNPPSNPSTGDRYLLHVGASGAFGGHDAQIAEWDGAAWQFTVCTVGTYVSVDDIPDGIFYFGGSSWTKKSFETVQFGPGFYKDTEMNIVYFANSLAGNGLKFNAPGELAIEENAGIEVTADGVGVKLDGNTIVKSSAGIKVNFSTALHTDGDGKLAVNVDSAGALIINGSTGGLEVNDGNGLEISSNKLQVKAKDTSLVVGSAGVSVNLGNGLGLDGTSGKVTLVLDPTSTGGISLGAAGLKLTIPIDVITESRYVTREPALGTVDGTNATFFVANEPVAGSESIFLEGTLMYPGDDYNFDYANKRFVFVAEQIPQVFEGVPDKIVVSYLKKP